MKKNNERFLFESPEDLMTLSTLSSATFHENKLVNTQTFFSLLFFAVAPSQHPADNSRSSIKHSISVVKAINYYYILL